MPGMEGHQIAEAGLLGQQFPPAPPEKEPFDEIFPDFRVMQPAFVFHRQEREMLHEDPGKEPHALARYPRLLIIDLDPGQAAARGFALKDKAAQIFGGQFPHPSFGPGLPERSVRSSLVRTVRSRGASGSPTRRMGSRGTPRPHSTSGQTGTNST